MTSIVLGIAARGAEILTSRAPFEYFAATGARVDALGKREVPPERAIRDLTDEMSPGWTRVVSAGGYAATDS